MVYAGHRLAAEATADARGAFIARTYFHLAAAIMAFVALEAVLLQIPAIREPLTAFALGGRWNWLIVLGAFMGVSWLADSWAKNDTSLGMQYAGLGLYVVAEAIIFVPLLSVVVFYMQAPDILPKAGLVTLVLFGGLTGVVFITRKDFSFM